MSAASTGSKSEPGMLSRPRPSVRPSASSVILEAKDFEQWELGDTKDAAALMKRAGEDVAGVAGVEASEQVTGAGRRCEPYRVD
jgi:hypothetical protein